jgi:autotransporter family porin
MASIGRAATDAVSSITGHTAKGRGNGYGIGVYATWYDNAGDDAGLYLDGWVHYGRFDNRVQGETLSGETYRSRGISASIEAGYAFRVRETQSSELFIQPQAQVIYNGYSMDDHTEANGTRVTGDAGGLTTRVGARIYGNTMMSGAQRVQPFVELNWWHSSANESVTLDAFSVDWNLPRNTYELKAGVQIELGAGWTGWGHLGWRQAGGGDYRNVEGQIGLMKRW